MIVNIAYVEIHVCMLGLYLSNNWIRTNVRMIKKKRKDKKRNARRTNVHMIKKKRKEIPVLIIRYVRTRC